MYDDFEIVRETLDILWGFNKARRIRAMAALDRIEARGAHGTVDVKVTLPEPCECGHPLFDACSTST